MQAFPLRVEVENELIAEQTPFVERQYRQRIGAGAATAKTLEVCFVRLVQRDDLRFLRLVQTKVVPDRNAAEALRGARVFVPRSSFPSVGEDEYYWVDLIGLAVVNREGVALGD